MNSWLAPSVAEAQRALADEQLQQQSPMPIQFCALADAVCFTKCPGDIWEVGCASGYNREVLDRQGVAYRSYGGNDISPAAIKIARERYPESIWSLDGFRHRMEEAKLTGVAFTPIADIMIDGCALMHADDWKAHLADLCARSRRWVILHRVPTHRDQTCRSATNAYGQEFGAWKFNTGDLSDATRAEGFRLQDALPADGGSWTAIYARPRIYATYADSAYLGRLKALHASMKRHCGPFELHVLAWDSGVIDWCASVGLPWSQAYHRVLSGPERTVVERMWTEGPQWIADVMERTGQPATYVDADIMFHSSPEPVFAEIGGAPAAVFPHNFARAAQGLPGPTVESHEVFGKYNVGLVYIADREIAEEWAAQCREWCYDRVEDVSSAEPRARREMGGPPANLPVPIPDRLRRYGDQKFLDAWPADNGAHVVQHPGADLGPWSVHTRAIDVRDGAVFFGGRPLVAFHYSSYRELPDGHTVLTRPEYRLTPRQEEIIYGPYIEELRRQR